MKMKLKLRAILLLTLLLSSEVFGIQSTCALQGEDHDFDAIAECVDGYPGAFEGKIAWMSAAFIEIQTSTEFYVE